jgi:hypothetical protein
VGRTKNPDDFGFKSFKKADSFKAPKTIRGSDNPNELLKTLPFHRRFRPPMLTKELSLQSDYDYASLWCRWRRGYELAMYSQQAYDGLTYSFKYYPVGTPGVGVFLPGACFMYPTTRSDMRMWMVGIRPRDSFNFLSFGYAISSVTQYDATTYAVQLNTRFGAPISFFAGEVVSNRYNADGSEKQYGYNNYTITGVGFNNVPLAPSYAPIFNTLFLSVSANNSWSVVDENTLSVPASGPPSVGEYLTTEMRAQCTCPDFLNREGYNLWNTNLRNRYPYTGIWNMRPGEYDAGSQAPIRSLQTPDDPGFARDFGFIYLNQIYNIPSYTSETSYSDPNVYYYQPKWCKHIYAAMWDMYLRYNQQDATSQWILHQPNDEPLNEYYRERFELDLKKQSDFLHREKNLVWWQRYSPQIDGMPDRMMQPDMYNMMAKTLNSGDLDALNTLSAPSFEMFTFDQYNPFEPLGLDNLEVYDGGTYANGSPVVSPVDILDGSVYANGTQGSITSYALNGGTY